jgi:uncharacterized membrane protein (DUF373 family)
LDIVEGIITRILALATVVVIFESTLNLAFTIVTQLSSPPYGQFGVKLIDVFGLLLDVLIGLELLENVVAYLRDKMLRVELVIATALIAVARKIIVLDFPNTNGLKLLGLAVAIVSLSVSYWLVYSIPRVIPSSPDSSSTPDEER